MQATVYLMMGFSYRTYVRTNVANDPLHPQVVNALIGSPEYAINDT